MNIHTFFGEMFSGAFLLRNGEPLVVVIFNGAFNYGCFYIFRLPFVSSIMPNFWGVLYFPLQSRWLLILARHFLDVQILIFIGFFDLEVNLIILSICCDFFLVETWSFYSLAESCLFVHAFSHIHCFCFHFSFRV